MTFAQNLKHIFITFSRLHFWQAPKPTRIPQHSDARDTWPSRTPRRDTENRFKLLRRCLKPKISENLGIQDSVQTSYCMTFAQNLKLIFITFSRLYFWQALGPTRIPQHSDARAIPGRAARHDAKQKIGSNF